MLYGFSMYDGFCTYYPPVALRGFFCARKFLENRETSRGNFSLQSRLFQEEFGSFNYFIDL